MDFDDDDENLEDEGKEQVKKVEKPKAATVSN